MTALAVIIPTLNEAQSLPGLLDQLAAQTDIDLQVVVADGGSSDATAAVVAAAGVGWLSTAPGRARQMNAALATVTAELVLFLHADSRLTSARQLALALSAFQAALAQRGDDRLAGRFALRFTVEASQRKGLAWRYYEAKTALPRVECVNGDQGCLISRRFMNELGGFDESLPFLEDRTLAEQVASRGAWLLLPGLLETSARRFEAEGMGRRMVLNAILLALRHGGVVDFLQDAPALYRAQREAKRLRLLPFFRRIGQLNHELAWLPWLKRWLAVGAYVRAASWQPFFLLDLMLLAPLGIQRRALLAVHDRLLAPVLNFWLFNALAAILTWLWFYTTWGWMRWRDES